MSQLDVGWRRFGQIDAALADDTQYNFTGNYGNNATVIYELIGADSNPTFGHIDYQPNGNLINPPIYAPAGATTYFGVNGFYCDGNTFTVNPGWEIVSNFYEALICRTTLSGWLPPVGGYGAWANDGYGVCWGGTWAILQPGGTFRRVIEQFREALPGNPHGTVITTPVLLNSLVLAFRASGVYFYKGGLNWSNDTVDPSSQAFVFGPQAKEWHDVANDPIDNRWEYHIATSGVQGEITEGWVTEVVPASDERVLTLSGTAGRGTLTAFDIDGYALTPVRDWIWYGSTGKTIKIVNPSVHSIITVSYLNMAHRMQRGSRTVRLTQSNTFHDRRRFSDIRGL